METRSSTTSLPGMTLSEIGGEKPQQKLQVYTRRQFLKSATAPFISQANDQSNLPSDGSISPGFSSGRYNWVEHSNYYDANDSRVIPFTPLSNPQYRGANGGQLLSPRQTPVTPPYNQPAVSPGPPHVAYVPAASHTELIPSGSGSQENFIDCINFRPGSFSRGDHSRNSGPVP